MTIAQETVKLLYNINASLQHMGYIVLSMKERECGISWTCLLEMQIVPSSSKIFLNGVEDEVCECNTFNCAFMYAATY